ncbi:MAG: GNAT family N-acetyltransferase [Chitinophagaceae bacterium]
MLPEYSLETERTFLRKLTIEDAVHFYGLNSDPDVIKFTGDKPFASIDEAAFFLSHYDQYQKYGVGRLAVIEKRTNKFIGWCGLKYNPEEEEYDLGFRFYRACWNKGFATETGKRCMEAGFKNLKLKTIVGRAMKENKASIKVLLKLNMKFKEPFFKEGEEGSVYQITNYDFDKTYTK